MIEIAFRLSVTIFPILVIVHLVCYSHFYDAIRDQRPEWLRYKGEPSIFYSGLPKRFDANVSVRAIAVAFRARAALLGRTALAYAQAIRVILPVSIALFGFILWYFRSKD